MIAKGTVSPRTVERYYKAIRNLIEHPGKWTSSQFSREHQISSSIVSHLVTLGLARVEQRLVFMNVLSFSYEDAKALLVMCNQSARDSAAAAAKRRELLGPNAPAAVARPVNSGKEPRRTVSILWGLISWTR